MATRSLELRWSFLLAGLVAAVLGYAGAWIAGGPPGWLGAAGALALAGALWALGGWVDRRLAAPVKAAGLIASRVAGGDLDRKSTRLNSSPSQISYAVFCLNKK